MPENTQTHAVGFSPEARAELLAMYTGMAMQGILMANVLDRPENIGQAAVAQANATIDALEAYHRAAAKQAEVPIDLGTVGAAEC